MDSRVSSPPLLPQAVYSHPKVTLTCRPAKPLFVAGQHLDGVLELACSSDKVWLGGIALEVRGAEQLHSRDHAASQAFLQSDVTFQSSKLPPSNAVIATSTSHSGFWPARKGVTRFPFSFAIPSGCPSSCKFAGNASVTYTLLASCQIQLENERSILTRRLDVNVVEQWQDWHTERFHEASEAQVREKVQTSISAIGSLAKSEGIVTAQAIIPDPLFYRGWELPDGSLELDRARGEISTQLFINNATSRTISGLKVSLLRRLKILPDSETPKDQTLVISAASAPRITEVVEEINLHGRGWEFPPSDQAKFVNCIVPLPIPEKFLSIRKTKLFEIHTVIKISLDMGTLNKPIFFELPIWVAHWASLPLSALQPRQAMRPPPIQRPMSSQGLMRAHSAGAIPFADSGPSLDTFGRRSPLTRSPFTTPQPIPSTPARSFPYDTSRSFAASPSLADVSRQISEEQAAFIPFDPYATSMTPSRFLNQETPCLQQSNADPRHYAPVHSPSQMDYVPISLASSAPASSYFQMLAQQRMTPSPRLPESITVPSAPTSIVRSQSADSRLSSSQGSVSSYAPRDLPPRMQEYLTEEEQARVLANSVPAVYDITERAYALRQQQQDSQTTLQKNTSPRNTPLSLNGRQRRQSMPTPPSAAQGRFSPVDAGALARPNKTPPLAPSSRFIVQLPFVSTTTSFEQEASITGLETIGEDGESQAGTIRFGKGTLGRSASHEQIRSLKAIRAVNTAVDEEGNTSVSLLEGIAERQDREKEAANKRQELDNQNNILAGLDPPLNRNKSLPKAPSSQSNGIINSPEGTSRGRKRIFDIFPEITPSTMSSPLRNKKAEPQVSPSELPAQAARAVSNPASGKVNKSEMKVGVPRPVMKSSKSDSLLALESRLSRSTSPMSPTFGDIRPPSLSPPPRSEAVSPVQRAISPVHIGNQGALRKKSSQISVKKQQKQQAGELESQSGPELKQPMPLSEEAKTRATQAKAPAEALKAKEVPAIRRPPGHPVMETIHKSDLNYLKAGASTGIVEPHLKSPLEPDANSTVVGVATAPKLVQSTTASGKPPLSRVARGKTAALAPRSPGRPLASSSPASSKRHTSDPQTSSPSQVPFKAAGLAGRRQSLDIPSDPVDKFGSARGGRGGVVTSVASLWADIISQESKNAKNQATLAVTDPVSRQGKRAIIDTSTSKPSSRAADQLHVAMINAKKAATAHPGRQIDKDKTDKPAKIDTELRKPTPQGPKARQAAASINATMGKPPTFAKSLGTPKASSGEALPSTQSEQGATNLRALIAKFS